MNNLAGFVDKNANTPKMNAEAEAALLELHSGAGGGGRMPPLTIQQKLDERIELLRFLIDAFTKENFVGENSTILNTFKEKCANILKIESAGRTETFITGVIKLIDEKIFLNEENKKHFNFFLIHCFKML